MLFPPPHPISTPHRVVATGAGILTALGAGWKNNAEGFRLGQNRFTPITLFDATHYRVHTAAQVQMPDLPQTRLSARQVARLGRADKLLLIAAGEAIHQARWQTPNSFPIIMGTTAGGMEQGEVYLRHARTHPHDSRSQPTRALYYQSHLQARVLCDAFGINGSTTIIANACATGASAIAQAWDMIHTGRADHVLTGGYDALSQFVFAGFDSLHTLSPTICRPFDAMRDGLMLGEGAAVLALESLESAQRRRAPILGEIAGCGACIDTNHLTQPHPQGDAAFKSMTQACACARITPKQIDYINAHGTGTPLNDSAEARAICRWAGEDAGDIPVSSTKASVGHTLGAAGAIEAVVCLMVLGGQWLPPETTLQTPDPLCLFPIVRHPQTTRVNTVLSNSFGFGGVNISLVLKRES